MAHSHNHDKEELKQGHSRCACCSDVSAPLPETDSKRLGPEQKKEMFQLIICAVIFAIAMIFEDKIAAGAGKLGVYAVYAIPYFICGLPVFKNAFEEIKEGKLFNEFTLMCVATIAAICLGHLSEAVGVMLFYTTGEFLQDLATAGSRGSIRALLASKPTTANVLENGNVRTEQVENVQVGSTVVVRVGEKIPLDGVVKSGQSLIDQSPLTGEPVPVRVNQGSAVKAGCINTEAVLEITTTSHFADTQVSKILEMVQNAAARKSPTERFITKFARYYTPAVVGLAALIAVVPPLLFGQTWDEWIYKALVLMVISCPCALLISVPLGYFGGIGAASRHGILVKGGNVFDSILHTNTVIFDKTGTITAGSFTVTRLAPAEGVSEDDLVQVAAIAECESSHPIAKAIMHRAANFTRPASIKAEEIAGNGMQVEADGNTYLAGTEKLMAKHGLTAQAAEGYGSVVHVAKGEKYLGHILVSDTMKADAPEAMQALHALGLKTAILSGDRKANVAKMAEQVGADSYLAELLPAEKVSSMEKVADVHATTYVGDGINDAPALAIAKVGIAMGGIGSEAAIEVADAVILNDSPAKVAKLYQVAKKVRTVVWQNIAMALGIKGLFMVLGVAGLSGLWEAVFADVGVALLAVLNAVRTMRS